MKINGKLKHITFISILILIVAFIGIKVNAQSNDLTKHINGNGIELTEKEYQIANAISNWQYPGWSNPLHFVESDSNAGTMMDIYSKPSSFWSTNVPMAETRHYDGNGNWMHPNSNRKLSGNYVFTRIYLNDTQMHNLSADKMKGTFRVNVSD